MSIKYNDIEEFEKGFLKKENMDLRKKYSILNGMYYETVALNRIPLKNPLDGLEIDINIARVVNSIPETF